MQMIGDEWADGSLKIIHEHLASSVVKSFLWDSLGSTRVYDPAPLMVLTTPAGQHCEIGALMTAVTAANAAWKIFYCGPDLPAEEIAAAALQKQALAVALGISCPTSASLMEHELGDGVRLFVGGRAACTYQPAITAAGGRCFRSIREFTDFLVQTETARP
jgi:methanogenic corrinoid protein MtbC1